MSSWTGLLEDVGVPDDALAGSMAALFTPDDALAGSGSAPGNDPVTVVVSSGAGGIAGACRVASRRTRLRALEVSLRDLDDLPGNARRVTTAVDQARGEGLLAAEVPVRVVLPPVAPGHGWLAAADEVASLELHLGLRTGAQDADLVPGAETVAAWIDAALDRELPFACGGGRHHGVRRPDAPGVLNLLLATRHLFDGGSRVEAAAVLAETGADALAHQAAETDPLGARRWLTAVATPEPESVATELDELLGDR